MVLYGITKIIVLFFKMTNVTESIVIEVCLLSAKYLLALPTPQCEIAPFERPLFGLSKEGLL